MRRTKQWPLHTCDPIAELNTVLNLVFWLGVVTTTDGVQQEAPQSQQQMVTGRNQPHRSRTPDLYFESTQDYIHHSKTANQISSQTTAECERCSTNTVRRAKQLNVNHTPHFPKRQLPILTNWYQNHTNLKGHIS